MTTAALLLLLGSWPVTTGRAVLEYLHGYDIERCDVSVVQGDTHLEVACALTVRVERAGPLRFLVSPEIDLHGVTGPDGRELTAVLGAGALDQVLRLLARGQPGVPTVLTVGPAFKAGETVRFELRYRWRPSGRGLAYVGAIGVQTHLSGFWLPTMANEFFDASVEFRGRFEAVATGERVDAGEGVRRFETREPVQVVCLVAGDFVVHRRKTGGRSLELYLPRGSGADPDPLLDDLVRVLDTLEGWFGPAVGPEFRVVVEPRRRPAPSYCAGSFLVLHPAVLRKAGGRIRWLELLAHECAHAWWGHGLATPIVGGGGTWLREGLAQWTGAKVAGALMDERAESALFRAYLRAYFSRLDLRRDERVPEILSANETTLLDATYLDPATVAYLRGALVLRTMEHALGGAKRFREKLRPLIGKANGRFLDASEFARDLGMERFCDYYAGTTRLPDFRLEEVETGEGSARAKVVVGDLAWPGDLVPCRIETDRGAHLVEVAIDSGRGILDWRGEGRPTRIEVDPERIFLDPIRSNSVWER